MDKTWRAVIDKTTTSSRVDEPAPAPVCRLPALVTARPEVDVEV